MVEFWDYEGGFVVCKNCAEPFPIEVAATGYLPNVKVLEERLSKEGDTELLKVEVECPRCFQTDTYLGGEENRWLDIIFADPTDAKDREKIYRLVEQALRKRSLQLQKQNLDLQEQLEKSRTQTRNLQKENKRLSDLAYAKLPADERRDMR